MKRSETGHTNMQKIHFLIKLKLFQFTVLPSISSSFLLLLFSSLFLLWFDWFVKHVAKNFIHYVLAGVTQAEHTPNMLTIYSGRWTWTPGQLAKHRYASPGAVYNQMDVTVKKKKKLHPCCGLDELQRGLENIYWLWILFIYLGVESHVNLAKIKHLLKMP